MMELASDILRERVVTSDKLDDESVECETERVDDEGCTITLFDVLAASSFSMALIESSLFMFVNSAFLPFKSVIS